MQILIRLSDGCEEWYIVELQGILETKDDLSLSNLWIGDLHFDTDGRPQMIIGHHLLSGSFVTLDKPLAVMKKKAGAVISAEEMESDLESDETKTSYEIIALVKKKLLFKNRPKPIVSKKMPIRV